MFSIKIVPAKKFLWKYLTARMHLDWTLRSGIKVIVRNYSDWCTYNEVFVNHEYTMAIQDALTEDKQQYYMMDLGANTGYFTLMAAHLHLEKRGDSMLNISLVEASPSLAVELGRRVAISDQRVSIQVLSGLVGKKGGFGMFNFAKEDNQNFVGEEEAIGSWVRTKGSRTLPYLDLTKAAAETPVIDLIKCDIEGSEFDFINTYADLLTKTVRLVVEFHSTFGDPLSAAEALAGMGFHHRAILRDSPETPVFYFSRA